MYDNIIIKGMLHFMKFCQKVFDSESVFCFILNATQELYNLNKNFYSTVVQYRSTDIITVFFVHLLQ